jgi:hypothetical protein
MPTEHSCTGPSHRRAVDRANECGIGDREFQMMKRTAEEGGPGRRGGGHEAGPEITRKARASKLDGPMPKTELLFALR